MTILPAQPPVCCCAKCIAACHRIPGLFMPGEAIKAVRAGLADRIMAIGFIDEHGHYLALAPISLPSGEGENLYRPEFSRPHYRHESWAAGGRCTFLTPEDRCEIHTSGFKPIECAMAMLCQPKDKSKPDGHNRARAAWATPVGHHVVVIWERERSRRSVAA